MNNDVAIILVNWNGYLDTIECIKSIESLRFHGNISVVVVDNSSLDHSYEKLCFWARDLLKFGDFIENHEKISDPRAGDCFSIKNKKIKIIFIKANRNYGFAIGNNIGIKLSIDNNLGSYFWILNNDTAVHEDSLRYLVSAMQSDNKIGMCGSTLLYYHDRSIVQAYGGVHYDKWTGRGWSIGGGEKFSLGRKFSAINYKECSYISGASMMISRDFYEKIGAMNENLFLYFEEIDWALRAKNLYKLHIEDKAIVYHKEGASIGTASIGRVGSPLSEFYLCRNKLKITYMYFPVCLPFVLMVLLARVVKLTARGYFSNAFAMVKALAGLKFKKA